MVRFTKAEKNIVRGFASSTHCHSSNLRSWRRRRSINRGAGLSVAKRLEWSLDVEEDPVCKLG